MWKTYTAKVMILLILVSCSSQVVNTEFGYGEYLCPLSRHNIKVAEELMETMQYLLENASIQGISTEEESLLNEANQLLQKAKMFSLHSQNCIAGNFFAIKAQNLLVKAKEILESRLGTVREEEYAVYRAFIDTGFYLIGYKYSRDEIQVIVIDDYTSVDESSFELEETLQWVGQKMPDVTQETLSNFQIRNAESHPLENYFNLTVRVVLIGDEEVREIFQKGGWEEFYISYPFSQGIMTLSRVGFNREMNQALLYIANEADDSIGGGYYILFTKENGIWIIRDWVISWVY